MVPMYPLVLFGGTAMEVLMHRGQFVLSLEEGWMKFITDTHQIAELLKEIRVELDNVLEAEQRSKTRCKMSRNRRQSSG